MVGVAPVLVTLAALVAEHDYHPPAPAATPAQKARVRELIAVMQREGRGGRASPKAAEAHSAVVAMGPMAAPFLARAVAKDGSAAGQHGAWTAASALDRLGRHAVEPVRREWDALGDAARWRLMRFRNTHDYTASLPFALASLASGDERVLGPALDHFACWCSDAKACKPLIALLDTAPPRLRWHTVKALGRVGGGEAVDALAALLDGNSWAARGEGLSVPPGAHWPDDGRADVVQALRAAGKAGAASPALLKLLRERGDGRAYLGDRIIPLLAEYGGPECVPELRRIADSPAGALERSPAWPPAEVKRRAAEAADRIAARNG